MKSFRNNLVAAGIVLAACTTVSGQQGGTPADLSITAMSLTAAGPLKKTAAPGSSANPGTRPVTMTPSDDILKCAITIHNDNTGHPRMTTLVLILPVDVTLVSSPANAVINKTGDQNRWGIPGSMVCDFSYMSPGTDITVEFSFTKSTHGNKVGAYIYSGCPDPEPANNSRSASY